MPPTPSFTTRKPSGKASWPSHLLAGVDHAGKSVAAAEASASDLIARTFWIEYGESTADAYGSVPGARYEIVEHDGSYLNVLLAVRWASDQPWVDGKPNLIVFDSGSELWSTLSEEQGIIARARRKKSEAEEVVITPDQWGVATTRWNKVIAVLRKHNGPTILTARLDEVMVMDRNGNPTKDKTWKVQAQKRTPFAMDMTIQMRAHRTFLLTGSRDLSLAIPDGSEGVDLPGFTFDALWRRMGLEDPNAVAHRVIVEGDAAAGVAEQESAALAADGDADYTPKLRPEVLVDMVNEIVQNAPENGPTLADRALGMILGQYGGPEALKQVGPCVGRTGEQMSAATYIERARAYVKGLPVTPAASDAPAADAQQPAPDAPASTDAPAVDAPTDAPAAAQEPVAETRVEEPAEPAEPAPAASEPAAAPAAPRVAATGLAAWLEELSTHARANDQSVEVYVRPLIETAPPTITTADQVPELVLCNWLNTRRKDVADKLDAKGQQTAAAALRSLGVKQPGSHAALFADADEKVAQPA